MRCMSIECGQQIEARDGEKLCGKYDFTINRNSEQLNICKEKMDKERKEKEAREWTSLP